jgi:hypothetical protein
MTRRIRLADPDGPEMGGQCPLVKVLTRSRWGDFAEVQFCIDTGADLTSLPVYLAEREGIAYPRDEDSRRRAGGLVGSVDCYRGTIQLRIFGEDFTWPCRFLDSPPPASREAYGVIGRAGFLAAFHFCIKGAYLTLERRLDDRPLWQRLLLSLLPPWTRTHAADQPL